VEVLVGEPELDGVVHGAQHGLAVGDAQDFAVEVGRGEPDVEGWVEHALAAAARRHRLQGPLEARQEERVSAEQGPYAGGARRLEQLREVAGLDPQVLQGREVRGVVGKTRGEEGAVEATCARADDDVDLEDDVELAAQVDPLRLRVGMPLSRADGTQELVDHPADPNRQAHAAVEGKAEPNLTKHPASSQRGAVGEIVLSTVSTTAPLPQPYAPNRVRHRPPARDRSRAHAARERA
jgi:hypothetical protein